MSRTTALRRTTAPRRTTVKALVLISMIGVLCAAGCGSEPDMKVVIIGLDGVDWSVADPLLQEGKMPNLARVIDNGVRSDLLSLLPLQKSPTIWTSIATGKGSRKHGIGDFVEGTDEQPLMNSTGWRARSIWSILGEKGYSVGLVGWLVTWPAQEVNGYCVVDRITYATEDGYPEIPDLTYPPELEAEVAPLRVSMKMTSDDDVADLMNGDVWRQGIEAKTWGGVRTAMSIHTSDTTIFRIAEHLLSSREQPDFFAVYFLGVDRASHRFWGQMDPTSVDIQTSDEVKEAFRYVVPRYYERMDRYIGDVLDSIDENTTVIICSDHGFRGPMRTPEGLQLGIQMHRDTGILAATGPGVKRGAKLASASVLDITPTILALLGEPVGRDMDGFVLTQMIDEEHLAANPVVYVDTYESETDPEADDSEEPLESELDDAIREELRSLGYIE